MRYGSSRTAAISVWRSFRYHREGIGRARSLPCRVGDTRLRPALVHMAINAGRFLRHAGHCQEWRDEYHCEDVFHGLYLRHLFKSTKSALYLQVRNSRKVAGGENTVWHLTHGLVAWCTATNSPGQSDYQFATTEKATICAL